MARRDELPADFRGKANAELCHAYPPGTATLARQIDASVSSESEPAKGTTVTVRLELTAPPRAAAPPPPTVAATPQAGD